jgi:hypothetical protein
MITKEKVRAKRNASPFVPFVIHTSKGDAFRVPAPGFILSASDVPWVVVQEQNGRLHIINVDLITSLEEAPAAPSQSAS